MRRFFREHLHPKAKECSHIPGFAIREICLWWSEILPPVWCQDSRGLCLRTNKVKEQVCMCKAQWWLRIFRDEDFSCTAPWCDGKQCEHCAICWWMSWDGNWFQAPPLDFGLLQDRGDPKLQIHMTSDPEEQKWFIYRKGCSIFWVRSCSLLHDICCLLSKRPIAFMQAQLASSYWPNQKSLLLGYWSCYIHRINFVLHFCSLQY